MIPRDVISKVKQIEIVTRNIVEDVFSGEYHSIFKGLGMEFSEVREYQPGDDVRSIDWNVTARMGQPFVKKYVEERELTVVFLVDASASGMFGSVERLKNEFAAEICAVLAFSAIKNNDRVGLAIFTDEVEKVVVPKKGRKHVLRVIRELLFYRPLKRGTSIREGMEYMMRLLTRRTVVFVVSDFLDEGFEKPLRSLARRHDVILMRIADPRELELPPVGMIELEDAETGRREVIDTGSRAAREGFSRLVNQRRQAQDSLFKSARVDCIDLTLGSSYIEPLMSFFRMREKKFR
ncbi:MAG: DUF58 domain-containing protein [Candidatus Glassbacteria bacterium]|nr:DUF58 domain-containing protein [Candidatus Glassbacteria bacterium]